MGKLGDDSTNHRADRGVIAREEVREAELLLHVIDASNHTWEEQRLVVDEVLADIGVHEKAVLHVFNKVDRMDAMDVAALRSRMGELVVRARLDVAAAGRFGAH